MKRNIAVPILIAMLALAAPAASRAETAGGESRAEMKRGMHGRPGMMEGLKLSDDQKSKLEEVHYRHEKKAIEMRADLRLASLDLHRLMRAESPDQRAIDAQIDRVSAKRASLHKAGVASMFEARALLTPEQRKLWHPGMMHRGMMRGGPGGGMGRGPHGGMMHGGPGGGMHEGMNGMQPDHDDEGDDS